MLNTKSLNGPVYIVAWQWRAGKRIPRSMETEHGNTAGIADETGPVGARPGDRAPEGRPQVPPDLIPTAVLGPFRQCKELAASRGRVASSFRTREKSVLSGRSSS